MTKQEKQQNISKDKTGSDIPDMLASNTSGFVIKSKDARQAVHISLTVAAIQ